MSLISSFQSPGGDFGSARANSAVGGMVKAVPVSVPRRGFRFCKDKLSATGKSQNYSRFSPPEGISVLQASPWTTWTPWRRSRFQSPGGDFGSARLNSYALRPRRRKNGFSPPEGISVLQGRRRPGCRRGRLCRVSVPRRGFRFCKARHFAVMASMTKEMFQSPGGDFGSAREWPFGQHVSTSCSFSPPEGISVLQVHFRGGDDDPRHAGFSPPEGISVLQA